MPPTWKTRWCGYFDDIWPHHRFRGADTILKSRTLLFLWKYKNPVPTSRGSSCLPDVASVINYMNIQQDPPLALPRCACKSEILRTFIRRTRPYKLKCRFTNMDIFRGGFAFSTKKTPGGPRGFWNAALRPRRATWRTTARWKVQALL